MTPTVSNEQLYDLACEVLRGFDKLLKSLDEVTALAKATNIELAQWDLPWIETPRIDGTFQ